MAKIYKYEKSTIIPIRSCFGMMGRVSSSLYLLILICFFFPFVSISCQKRDVATVTGMDLAIGKGLPDETILWSRERSIPPQPLAITALILAIAGAATGALKPKIGALWGSLLGLLGMVTLFLLKNKVDGELVKYSKLLFAVKYEHWYWTALFLFGLAGLANLLRLLKLRKMKISPQDAE
jgi:hypothetical protein